MSSSQQVYLTVSQRLADILPNERLTRRRNLALFAPAQYIRDWVTALYLASSCALTRLADHLLVNGNKDSRVQRLRRFLMNKRVDVRTVYGPVVGSLLTQMGNARIVLILDRTTLSNHLNILTVSIAYRGRSLPLAWRVMRKQGQMQRCHLEAALRFVKRWAPDSPHIWVVGDREFQDVGFQDFIEHELGWQYVQRITNNLWLYPEHGAPFQPKQLGLQPGQRRVFANVRVTRQQAGPAHFLAYWRRGEDEPWYLLSDQPINRATIRIYAQRFWVEPMYRDFKSFGWNIEASRIRNPQRFSRLLLGTPSRTGTQCSTHWTARDWVALAYVWLLQLASRVIKRGWRRLVDRTARRTLSYFRIGWNWLLRCINHGEPIVLPDLLYL